MPVPVRVALIDANGVNLENADIIGESEIALAHCACLGTWVGMHVNAQRCSDDED